MRPGTAFMSRSAWRFRPWVCCSCSLSKDLGSQWATRSTRMGKNDAMAYEYRFERPRVLSMVLAGGEGKRLAPLTPIAPSRPSRSPAATA